MSRRRPLDERLWERVVEADDGCWLWTGAPNTYGYGQIGEGGYHGRKLMVHRVAYTLVVGVIPAGMEIDHLCRNRMCVNPAHLEVVTGRENTLRGNGPAGRNARKTHCPRGHALTGENVKRTGRSRYCAMCKQAQGAGRSR